MPNGIADQIVQLRQSIAALEQQQAAHGIDLSESLERLRRLLAQLEQAASIANTGSGAIVTQGGIAAGAGGVAIGRDVWGDVLVDSTKIVYPGEDPQAAQALLNRYLKWLVVECAPLKLKAIDQGAARPGQPPLGLTSVYVDLNLDLRIPSKYQTLSAFLQDDRAKMPARRHEPVVELERGEQVRQVAALEALACHSRLVLLGAPGSGKSTLSLYLALSLAQAGLGIDAALKRLGQDWTFGPALPVRVVLRHFAASLTADLRRGRAGHLWEFIATELANSGLPKETGPLLRDVAEKSGALFLLDGLDEAGDETRRARVLEAVAEFMRSAGEKCRFLLTARPYAWEEDGQRSAQLPHAYRLADFDPAQIATFVERWYQAISASGWVGAAEAAEKTRALQEVVQHVDLLPLARNPLLLTLMATLHSNRTRLPDDRADLYQEVVELLLQRWNEPSGMDRSLLAALDIPTLKLSDLRAAIERMAFEAHQAHVGKEGAADIAEPVLLDAFRPLLGNSLDRARLVVDYVENRAGLLLGQGTREKIRQFTFPHRTFQEFLAACHLAGRADFLEQAVDLARAAPAHWREALVLAARLAGPGRGVPVADALVHAQSAEEYRRKGRATTEADWRAAILAGAQLLEIGLAVLDSREAYRVVRERVAGWLRALIETPRRLSLPERIEAGNLLGRLGDPRFQVATAADGSPYILPPIVCVKGGPFEMGSHKDEPDVYSNEYSAATKNRRHRVDAPEFWIGVYPVTNAEYRCFVQAASHAAPKHWQGGNPPAGLESHPVVNVSWRDALAYCEWLSHVSSREVRLPSEAEWEKAARWDAAQKHSRVYPWGDEWEAARCNTAEEGPGGTTPVGLYPDGASPAGLHDAAGNVLEWCRSKFADYPYRSDDGRELIGGDDSRVLRGGAWYYLGRLARCACRFDDLPGSRLVSFGFRVVVSPGASEG
ncbi:MAG TPA: SUMF1/EgtB/PvdO family nonheme iron enzyme [Anaerolineae bacterium]|nr:SUMF1/EgtB/PvdO family nonheme iron enzyme [Anaerolineae bacterium]